MKWMCVGGGWWGSLNLFIIILPGWIMPTRSSPDLLWILCAGVFCSEYPGLDKHYYHK